MLKKNTTELDTISWSEPNFQSVWNVIKSSIYKERRITSMKQAGLPLVVMQCFSSFGT